MNCRDCKGLTVKNGKQKNGKQRYYCKNCKKSCQRSYCYSGYHKTINKSIYNFTKEGVGIRAISRLLSISKTTVIKRIKYMASQIKKPVFKERHQYYEMDEMRVVVHYKQKEAWIIYALNRYTKAIIDLVVGERTKRNISTITKSVLQLDPKMIYTDGLSTYKNLIPKQQHNTRKKNTTIIERHNLTLRTHLKRLGRKTICFSKTFETLRLH